jgi:hypothetical protein
MVPGPSQGSTVRKVKKPAGLNMRPTLLRQDCLGASPAVCRGDAGARLGVCSRIGLDAADGDNLVPGPDWDGEGAGSAVQNGVEAIVECLEQWNDAATTDPYEGGGEELGWQLAGQLGARIVPRQGKGRKI